MALRRLSIASSLLTLLASSVLMTACQYPDDDDAPAGATPSSVNPQPADTRSYVSGVRTAITPGVGGADDTVSTVLSLVDDVTGAEVSAIAIDALTDAKVAQAFTVTAEGYQAGRQTKAYYVYQHKLYEVSLEHDGNVLSKPTPRQVSSETQACAVSRVVESDTTAQTSYLSYKSAGADGLCNTLDDVAKTALSSANETTGTGPAFLEVQRDSTGAVSRFLGIDANKLVIGNVSTQLTTAVINGSIPSGSSVSVFAKMAGTTDKIYLRVGSEVRVLDWAGAALGGSAVATLHLDQTPSVHTDTTDTYFIDAASVPAATSADSAQVELVLWRLKPTQTSPERVAGLGATAPEQIPQIGNSAMTPTSLALVVRRESGDTLTIIKKIGGDKRDVALSGPTAQIGIQAHAGEVLLISQKLSTETDAAALTRVNLGNSDSLSALSASASLVTLINGTSTTLGGEVPSSYLLWNESGAVRSHSLSGNTTLTIANGSTLTGWNGGELSSAVSNLTTSLLRGHTSATPNAETLWLFNATKAVVANN